MKNLTRVLLVLAVIMTAWACTGETGPDKSGASGDALIYLRLKTPEGFISPASRSLTFEQENTIEDIYVLVFDSGGLLKTIQQGQVASSTPGSDNPIYSGEGSFLVTVPPSANSSDTYTLMVLANAYDELALVVGTDDDATTYLGAHHDDILKLIDNSITGKMYNSSTDNSIPMCGEIDDLVITPGSSTETVVLTRACARIDVGVGEASESNYAWSWNGLDTDGNEIPFILGHVYVMRPNDMYSVVPYADVEAGLPSVPDDADAFDAVTSESIFEYAATASDNGGYTSQDIYVPESDIIMSVGGTLGDLNHTNRMAIVVGGYYNNSSDETFYRLDFAVNRNLIDVLRNHLYQFSISKVTGPGYGDVQTAYESQSMNMEMVINDWNATDMKEIFLDGSLYVMLGESANYSNDDRMAVVYRVAGSEDRFEIRTNIALDEFELSLDNDGFLPDDENPLLIQNDRFLVELRTENGVNNFVFTALQAYDPSATDNPSTLTVTTSRIRFEIVILQIDNDPGDWVDGGNIDKELS